MKGTDTMENMTVNVVNSKPCSVTLHVEIPAPEVTQETEKVYDEIQKNAQVPGFRTGKAPLDFVKKNYSVTAREKIIENLIQRSLLPVLQQQKIDPVAYPRIEKVNFEFDKPFSFDIYTERNPEVTVKDYKGIKIKKEIIPVTDAKVQESIVSLRERNSRLVESSAEIVAATHFLLVDYDALVDQKPVEDLGAKNQLIDLTAAQTLAGFKEGLVGAKKGETKEIKVKFPEAHPNKKLANKEVTFKVTINSIKEKQLPAADDEFAKDFGIGSLAELQQKIRETLEIEEKKRQEQSVEKQVIDHLLNANTFEVPESLIEEQMNYLLARAADYFRKQGLPQDAWQKNADQLRDKYKQEAERTVRLSYIFNTLASTEKIDITEEDLVKEHEKMKTTNPGREAEVDKYYTENKKKIEAQLKEEGIFQFLLSQAKIKEETKS